MSRVCSQEPGNLPGELLLILRVKGASYRSRRHEMMATRVVARRRLSTWEDRRCCDALREGGLPAGFRSNLHPARGDGELLYFLVSEVTRCVFAHRLFVFSLCSCSL